MYKKLPQKGFKWMTTDELQNLDILGYDEKGDTGCVLKVC